MLYAKTKAGTLIQATPKSEAYCPGCGNCVHAKCGQINVWHWAHSSGRDCDPWHEPESKWHAAWKQSAPSCEVVIGPHRADIVTRSGVVVELQHSYLSVAEIQERERFYRNMIWVWDCREAFNTVHDKREYGSLTTQPFTVVTKRLHIEPKNDYYTFRWYHPRRTIAACKCPVYLDLGDQLFQVRRHYEGFRRGWGHLIEPSQFMYQVLWNF
jgi:competence protein CoiA